MPWRLPGVPGDSRISNRLLKGSGLRPGPGRGEITKEVVDAALNLLEIDKLGLDSLDHKLLQTIICKFGGGPVGLNTLSAAVNEESETIEEVYEPYLLQIGFLERTPRGRVATALAYKHLGLDYQGPERSLFD